MDKTLAPTTLPNDYLTPALSHLQTSSQLLIHKSRALSAYLEAHRSAIIPPGHASQRHQSDDDASRRICRTCGNTMIPGWSCKKDRRVVTETAGQKRKRSKSQSTDDSHIAYQCDLCHSVSRFKRREKTVEQVAVPKSVPAIPTPRTATASTKPVQETVIDAKKAPSTLSSASATPAKKRSKKAKSGGLAAMLQLAKAKNESSSSAFDLMDFMKSG